LWNVKDVTLKHLSSFSTGNDIKKYNRSPDFMMAMMGYI
jgi:hypothetical protein